MENNKNIYSSEKEIEERLIKKLQSLGYTYRPDIRTNNELERNFREKFNRLNGVKLTDTEFDKLKDQIINKDIFTASKQLRGIDTLKRDDEIPLHFKLLNIDDWCQNEFEVINQLKIDNDYSYHRYDVILLMNGIPVIQIELKNHSIVPKKAMEQIVAYKNDKGNGYTNSLLCFIQLFIISNEHSTSYFANNRDEHFKFNSDETFLPLYKLADKNNNKITYLYDFADAFLSKCTLAELINRYIVLVEHDSKILIMRPYQIYAVKAIIDCINENRGNGYIWHTTGSGKTLTSFKASTILKENNNIYKCLFVVDRKDLDSQTRDEFNKFQEGCVEENINTASLVEKLLSEDKKDKIIVTTIQKLGIALGNDTINNKTDDKKKPNPYKEQLKKIEDKRFVFIFDECHRSQFGDNHKAIKKFFPNSQLFGFTGTPIFEENASRTKIQDNEQSYLTTEDIFEKELHKYTITNAIDDKTVLKFHVEHYDRTNREDNIKPSSSSVKRKIVDAILKKHQLLTDEMRFNSIFATYRINDAIEYYNLFKEMQENNEYIKRKLNIACVFTPPAETKDIEQIQNDLPQEKEDYKEQPQEKKAALINIINDYNKQYGTNYNINTFYDYYKDIQTRIKSQQYTNKDFNYNKKVDIVIVVDMLLTGFDSKYLNTLYVDKNLKYHHLIQAFSRTNRVLNNTKPYGNIVDFRNQKEEVNEAVILFSGVENNDNVKNIWLVEPYSNVIDEFEISVKKLADYMHSHNLEFHPSSVANLKGDEAKIEFIDLFRHIQQTKTKLNQYTEIPDDMLKKINNIMPEDDLRGFRSEYLEVAQEMQKKANSTNNKDDREEEKADTTETDIQNIDFEFVLFSSAIIDYDYIMELISKYITSSVDGTEEMTKEKLISIMTSTSNLIEEKEMITDYINNLPTNKKLSKEDIEKGYKEFKNNQLNIQVTNVANKFDLNSLELIEFVKDICDNMIFDGEKLDNIKWNMELNWKEKAKKEEELMHMLLPIIKSVTKEKEVKGLNAYDNN